MDHVYKTWWFLGIIFLFGLSLTLCTILQQLPSLRIARRCQFFRTTEQFRRLKVSTISKNSSFNRILSRLKINKYSIFQQKNLIYSYKGLVGRIAPIIVHFSMILILFGTIVGSLLGFKAQEIIPTTETFHIQNILNNGPLTRVPQITARVNNFWITYTKQKTISQFYSDLSILNQLGNEIDRKTVRVNSPLIHKNVYYYQTDWNLIGLRFQTYNNKIIEYPLTNILNTQDKIGLTWLSHNELNKGFLLIIDNLEGYCSVYNEEGQFLGNVELNEKTYFTQSLALLEIVSSAGLQIKTDPGIFTIYCGFLFLIISTLISYITYSQVWIVRKSKQTFIGGSTNRASFEFELEFFKLAK